MGGGVEKRGCVCECEKRISQSSWLDYVGKDEEVGRGKSRHNCYFKWWPPEVYGDPYQSVYSVINLSIHTITCK